MSFILFAVGIVVGAVLVIVFGKNNKRKVESLRKIIVANSNKMETEVRSALENAIK